MKLWTRVWRVEQTARFQLPAEPREDGQDPPCPPWFDPADWASRMRISRCSQDRVDGVLQPGEYLPDMDEAERRYVDGLLGVFAEFAGTRTQEPAASPAAGVGGNAS